MHKKIAAYLFFLFFFLYATAQQRSLDYFINQGLSNSPLLKDYQNQIKSGVVDSLMVKAGNKPKIETTGQIIVPPYGKNYGYDEAITNGGTYSALVGISQNLLMKRNNTNAYENINLQNKSALNNSKITEQELKKLISSQYLTAYTTYNEMLFAKQVLELLKEEEQLLKQLAEKGVYKQTDYLSFLIEEQAQEGEVTQQQIDYRQSLYDLNYTCGINDTTLFVLPDPQIIQTKNLALENSPVFQKFKIDSLININSQKAISLNYRPSLGWFADMGVNSISPLNVYKNFGFSVGLNFKLPIYDGKQKDMQIQKLKISDDSRKNYEDFYKKQYSQKVQQLNQKIASYDILTIQINKQLGSIESLIKMNKLQLNTGDLSITDHVLTIKNYIETKHQLNVLQFEKMQTIIEVNYTDTQIGN